MNQFILKLALALCWISCVAFLYFQYMAFCIGVQAEVGEGGEKDETRKAENSSVRNGF